MVVTWVGVVQMKNVGVVLVRELDEEAEKDKQD